MKKNIKNTTILFVIIFIFFLSISFLMPISGDDWGNYLVGKGASIRSVLGNAAGMYFLWEGRFVSRVIINIVTYNKWLFNIILSFLITSFVYITANFIKVKDKKFIYMLSFISILFLENTIFTQSILWIAGSVTYMFPTVLSLMYLYFYIKCIHKKTSYKWYVYIILGLFSACMSMFVENIAFAFVFMNFILLVYEKIKYKCINRMLLSCFILSLVSAIIMLLSPGSSSRKMMENPHYYNSSLFYKVAYGYCSFIYYTFMRNCYLIILVATTNYLLITKYVKKVIKWLYYIIFSFIPIWLGIIFVLNNFDIKILESLLNYKSILVILYWSLFSLFSLYLFYLYIKKTKKYLIVLLIIVGVSANVIMMVVPTWGGRTTLFTTLYLSISYILILDDILDDKFKYKLYNIIKYPTYVVVILYLITYINVYKFNRFQENSIKEEIKNNKKEITIYTLPERLTWGLIPYGDYHVEKYKAYYGIDEDATFKYEKTKWNYGIIFKKK